MKNLIGIFAVLLWIVSCGGNTQNSPKSEVLFVEVSDENKKLFLDEIGTNAELYLGVLAENYQISNALPITVFDRKESELSHSANDMELDGHMFTLAVRPITSEDIGDHIQQTKYQKVADDNAVGYVLYLSNDEYISYIYFPEDQRSFSFFPVSVSKSLEFIENNNNDPLFAGKSETDQLVTVNVIRCQHSLYSQVLTSFNCQLSNGKTLRVGFLAERKQSN
jgi:hypothetical protein